MSLHDDFAADFAFVKFDFEKINTPSQAANFQHRAHLFLLEHQTAFRVKYLDIRKPEGFQIIDLQ